MSDVYREVTRTGYGSRLKGAVGGIVVGFLMFVAAFPLVWWNEGRAVKQRASLNEGAAAVVAVGSEQVEPANEGKLVHVGGRVTATGTLSDPDFGFEVKALGLRRSVEMYQWKEKRESREEKKLGGGTETVTTYRYETDWDDELIDSRQFKVPQGHANPGAFPLDSRRVMADSARLGGYTLDSSLVAELDDWQSFKPGGESLAPPEGFRAERDGYYRGGDPGNPQVGDVRVRFRQVPEGNHSFVARQAGTGLAPYPTKAGNDILLVESGLVSAADMFKSAHRANNILSWVIRGIGFALMWIGLGLVLRPLSVLLDVIPLIGTIVGKGIGLVTFLLAAMCVLVTIALAWIWYRPLLGVSLLVLAVVAVFWLKQRRPVPAASASTAAMPPPPPPPPPPRPA
jgi:hypothetical protein